jgi:hypothetical protein
MAKNTQHRTLGKLVKNVVLKGVKSVDPIHKFGTNE